VELYSKVFEALGYDPLPAYEPHPYSQESNPTKAAEYPLIMLNGARVREYMLSTWRNIESVRKRYPDPLVQIHPETAQEHLLAQIISSELDDKNLERKLELKIKKFKFSRANVAAITVTYPIDFLPS
jgi:hypothetical protein